MTGEDDVTVELKLAQALHNRDRAQRPCSGSAQGGISSSPVWYLWQRPGEQAEVELAQAVSFLHLHVTKSSACQPLLQTNQLKFWHNVKHKVSHEKPAEPTGGVLWHLGSKQHQTGPEIFPLHLV